MSPSLIAAGTVTGPAHAADACPRRPIRMLAPFAAGSSIDLMARPSARKLHPLPGQPVVAENRGDKRPVMYHAHFPYGAA